MTLSSNFGSIEFNALERAVLNKICELHTEDAQKLAQQLATAVVSRRENTGAGFYTYFSVDRSTAPAPNCSEFAGDVWARIDGFENEMTFVLIVEDGYATCLEGATCGDDSTASIDFSNVTFKIDDEGVDI